MAETTANTPAATISLALGSGETRSPSDAVKRGPGRPPNPSKADEPKAKGTNVTYVPRDGDPVSTVWHGHTFRAGKPTPVAHEGLLAAAKLNPWFEVEGYDAAKPVVTDGPPTDPESYRRYAIAWFKEVKSSAEMKTRWDSEQAMREACGVGTQDIEYLDKLLTPRMAELKQAEG